MQVRKPHTQGPSVNPARMANTTLDIVKVMSVIIVSLVVGNLFTI